MKTYKIVGIEPWLSPNGDNMQRLYCIFKQENTVGYATIACSILASRIPNDIGVDSVVILGFERQGKYLEFVMLAPNNNQ